jgi:hypothetical protein
MFTPERVNSCIAARFDSAYIGRHRAGGGDGPRDTARNRRPT